MINFKNASLQLLILFFVYQGCKAPRKDGLKNFNNEHQKLTTVTGRKALKALCNIYDGVWRSEVAPSNGKVSSYMAKLALDRLGHEELRLTGKKLRYFKELNKADLQYASPFLSKRFQEEFRRQGGGEGFEADRVLF